MNFLLDTNVISEPTKPRPNKGVMAWLAGVNEDSVFLREVTITELRYGIERLTAGKHRRRLDEWLRSELTARFQGRILGIDVDWPTRAADLWRAVNLMAKRWSHATHSSPPPRGSTGSHWLLAMLLTSKPS
jgi:predicted nucleic acid-binding protein